jgi:DNA polymerase-3 subunit delta'
VSWKDILGHEALAARFRNIVARGRLAHAYLFTGPPGIGKKRFALELAKTVLCDSPASTDPPDPCDRCPGCVQVSAGTHPDLRLVGASGDQHEFPIEQMQELIAHLGLKPARGRYRVAIVDAAERLSLEAANCFLKTLEEPPPRSLLFLIAPNPEQLLPTIRSRCQIVPFAPLPPAVLARLLRRLGLADSPEAATRLAGESQGSLGRASELSQPQVQQFRSRLRELLAKTPLDSVQLGQLLTHFAEHDAKDSAARRDRARLALSLLAEELRQHLRQALAGPEEQQAALADALDTVLLAAEQVDRWLHLALVLEACADRLGQHLA